MRWRLVALVCLALVGCGALHEARRVETAARCAARAGGQLPDPTCTPGVVDPRVSQGNIARTICAHGYTATVRPPASYTTALKRRQIVEYGYADANPRDYEEDHLISLELGGAPTDPRNLWPEYGRSPNAKDRVENLLHRQVCSGKVGLRDAQSAIAGNWTLVARPG